MVTVTSLPLASSTFRPRASAYLRPNWKMWPISMPRARLSAPEPSGDGSPVAHLGDVEHPVGSEVTTGDQIDDVGVGCVRPGHPAGPGDHPGIDQIAHPRRMVGAEQLGDVPVDEGGRTDVALDEHRMGREVLIGERHRFGRGQRSLEPLQVHLAIAGQADDQRFASSRPG